MLGYVCDSAEPFTVFVAPFTHGKNFHLSRSFRLEGRTVPFSSYLTNMIRGQEDSSFWPLSRELFRSIPPDAALSMLDPPLSEHPWVAAVPDDPEFRGVPPPRTFTINLSRLPVGALRKLLKKKGRLLPPHIPASASVRLSWLPEVPGNPHLKLSEQSIVAEAGNSCSGSTEGPFQNHLSTAPKMRLEPPTPKKRPSGHRAAMNRHENEPDYEHSCRDLSYHWEYIYSHILQLKKGPNGFSIRDMRTDIPLRRLRLQGQQPHSSPGLSSSASPQRAGTACKRHPATQSKRKPLAPTFDLTLSAVHLDSVLESREKLRAQSRSKSRLPLESEVARMRPPSSKKDLICG